MKTSFNCILQSFGNNVAIVVPPENLEELQAGKRPPVKVWVNEYEYQSTIASMNGQFLLPFAKEHRERSGYQGGDSVAVTLTLESNNREVLLPDDLTIALTDNDLMNIFEEKSYSIRKEFVRQVIDSKKVETRIKRIQLIIEQLNPDQ